MSEKAKGIEGLSAEALKCRDLGHKWDEETDFDIVRNARGQITLFSRLVRCERCKLPRKDEYDRTLDRSSGTKYGYNEIDNYLMEPGHGRVRGRDARRESLSRLFDLDDVPEPPPPPQRRRSSTRRSR